LTEGKEATERKKGALARSNARRPDDVSKKPCAAASISIKVDNQRKKKHPFSVENALGRHVGISFLG